MLDGNNASSGSFQDSVWFSSSGHTDLFAPDLTDLNPWQGRYQGALQNDLPAIIAGDRFVDNGSSNLEGDPLSVWDDGTIYIGRQLALNTATTLPIRRNSNGDPITGTNGTLIPIDDAIVLSPDARVRDFPSSLYGSWQPSQTDYSLTAQIPSSKALLDEILLSTDTVNNVVSIDVSQTPLHTSIDWDSFLNTIDTSDGLTVIHVTGGGLDFRNSISLENIVFIVEEGDVYFRGRNSQIDNVIIIVKAGDININRRITANNLTLFAGNSIRLNKEAELGGENLLVSGNDVLFRGLTTVGGSDTVNVVAEDDIKFNNSASVRGVFLAGGSVFANRQATIVGSIQAKDDVIFNQHVQFVYEAINTLPLKLKANQPLIGVLDTGISNNPDFDPDRLILLHDYVDGDDNPLLITGQGSDHGTHIAGIIAAMRGNGIGIDGMNPNALLAVSRVIGSGKWAEALIAFVDYARSSGQPNAIVNLSLDLTQINPDGSITTRYELTPTERAALEYARQHGILIVTAAGNDGGIMSVLGQASQEFDNIITVGAVDGDGRASYSSYGLGLDIVAYGGTVDNPVISTVSDGIGAMAGTSVAAAQVSGAASLVWAENPNLTYKQVITILQTTATDLALPDWDRETGFGLLNTDAAIELAKVTEAEPFGLEGTPAIPTTWGGDGRVIPLERAVWTATEIGQQPTGGTYATGYIPPFRGQATLTQDWNSAFSHNGGSSYAKDWTIADRKVYAAKGGVVTFVKEDSTIYGNSAAYRDYANYVIIRHDDGKESLYVHLEANSVPVNVGDVVEAGTFIGLTGLSGWITGEHLHFVVRDSNTRQSIPFAFNLDGDGGVTPQPLPINSTGDFTGQIIATDWANIRSGPGTQFTDVGDLLFNTTVEFDGWTIGEFVDYTEELGTSSDIWYKIKGQDTWVSAALVDGQPPQSQVPVGSVEFMGKYYIFVPYTIQQDDTLSDIALNTMGNGSENYYNFIAAKNGIPDPNLIFAGDTILIPQEVAPGTIFPPASNFQSVYEQYKSTLGQPISDITDHSSGAQYQLFENGSIVSSQFGTFPLYGGIRQEYLSTGGLNGWLGVPTSAEVGQGNGVIKQTFENGYIIWNGYNATAYASGPGIPIPIDLPPSNPTLAPIQEISGFPTSINIGQSSYDDYMKGDDWQSGDTNLLQELDNALEPFRKAGISVPYIEDSLNNTFLSLITAGTLVKGGDPLVTLPFYQRFLNGDGGEFSIDSNDLLAKQARDDLSGNIGMKFKENFEAIRDQTIEIITAELQRQLSNGSMSGDTLQQSLENTLSLPRVEFNDNNLFVLIHGTQKAEVSVNDIRASLDLSDKGVWQGTFAYTVFDDFGFSASDAGEDYIDLGNEIEEALNLARSFNLFGASQKVVNIVRSLGVASVTGLGYLLQQYGAAKPYGLKVYVKEQVGSSLS